jgi:hypothetical protein
MTAPQPNASLLDFAAGLVHAKHADFRAWYAALTPDERKAYDAAEASKLRADPAVREYLTAKGRIGENEP